MCRYVLSVGLQKENKVGAEDLSSVEIKYEEFWTMLKKLALIYCGFLGHRLDEKFGPSQQKKRGVEETTWSSFDLCYNLGDTL